MRRAIFPDGWRRMFCSVVRECDWQVSSYGRLFCLRRGIWPGTVDSSGYHVTKIGGEMWKVHRIVKLTFDGRPRNECAWEVNHLDGNKSNNHLSNLAFATRSENMAHFYAATARLAARRTRAVLWRKVGCKSWTQVPSRGQTALELGISPSTISRCCNSASEAKGHEFQWAPYKERDEQGEEWRDMVDPRSGALVPGRMVSSSGRTRLKDGSRTLGCLQQQGYRRTHISRGDGSFRNEYMHRLVAAAFLGPPPSLHHTHVNHKDFNKCNNAVANLEYVTAAQNAAHRHARVQGVLVYRPAPIESRLYGTNAQWTWHPSRKEAARARSLHYDSVTKCLTGRVQQVKGYEFRRGNTPETCSLPGEEWRQVDFQILLKDKATRR